MTHEKCVKRNVCGFKPTSDEQPFLAFFETGAELKGDENRQEVSDD